jgi:hypothetical protein
VVACSLSHRTAVQFWGATVRRIMANLVTELLVVAGSLRDVAVSGLASLSKAEGSESAGKEESRYACCKASYETNVGGGAVAVTGTRAGIGCRWRCAG